MSKRRRSLDIRSTLNDAPVCRKSRRHQTDMPSKPSVIQSSREFKIRKLVAGMISRCTPGYWLRILPDDDDEDSIWHAALNDWDIAITALVHVGLIKPAKQSGVLACNTNAWEMIRDEFDLKFEMNHFKARENTKLQHFICIGPPRYNSAHDQVKAWPRIPIVPSDNRNKELTQFKKWRDEILDQFWIEAEFLAAGNQDTGLTGAPAPKTPAADRCKSRSRTSVYRTKLC